MSSYRFDQEKAIAAWRRILEYNRAFSAVDLKQNMRDQEFGPADF